MSISERLIVIWKSVVWNIFGKSVFFQITFDRVLKSQNRHRIRTPLAKAVISHYFLSIFINSNPPNGRGGVFVGPWRWVGDVKKKIRNRVENYVRQTKVGFFSSENQSSATGPKKKLRFFCSCLDINTMSSTHQHNVINTSTPTHQHINTSTRQHINTPTHQHTSTLTHQHVNTSTHQNINTSTHQHSHQHLHTHQHINTSTGQLINT